MEMTNDAEQESLLHLEVGRLTGKECAACSRRLCGHHIVLSILLGLKNAPHCLSCTAHQLSRTASDMREQLVQYVRHRECYRRAWEKVDTCLTEGDHWPTCMQVQSCSDERIEPGASLSEEGISSTGEIVARWDAGDLGCGELVLGLRARLLKLKAGAVLELIARDPAAPEDLPAWCRLTGHQLVAASHPTYLIERKRG